LFTGVEGSLAAKHPELFGNMKAWVASQEGLADDELASCRISSRGNILSMGMSFGSILLLVSQED